MGEPARAGIERRHRTGRALRIGLIVLLCILAAVTLGFLAPLVIPLGVIIVLLVLVDPADLGSRLRHSPGWWGFPGLQRASRGASSFAALLAVYTIVVPGLALGGIVLVISGHRVAPVVAAPGPGVGVGSLPPGSPLGTPTGAQATGSTPSPGSGHGSTAAAGMAAAASATATSRSASPAPGGSPTAGPSPTSTSTPTAGPTPTPGPSPTPSPALCGAPANPWGYDLCNDGDGVVSPPLPATFCSVFTCVADFASGTGNVVECSSGLYSLSSNAHQQCGKVLQPLYV